MLTPSLTRRLFTATLCAAAALPGLGCEEKAPQPAKAPAAAPIPARPAANSLDLQPTHPAPEYTLEVLPNPSDPARSIVKWTAKVDSTGWSLKTESVLEEENNGMWARAYVVISEPQPGDTIDKTPQVITGIHEATQKIDKAELSMKHTVRDAKPTFAPLYSVVKKTHDW